MTLEEVREMLDYIGLHRGSNDAPFDVVIGGQTSGAEHERDVATVELYIEAGATWWLEDSSPWAFGWKWSGAWPVEAIRDRVRRGRPRPLRA